MRRMIAASVMMFLAACGPSGVTVVDDNGTIVGEVRVENADDATVLDRNDRIVGTVDGNDIRDRDGSRVGRVRSDGFTIEDRNGTRVGRVRDETRCIDRDGSSVGEIRANIDDQAAGGACLLLLLL